MEVIPNLALVFGGDTPASQQYLPKRLRRQQ
jgi:hypothetical protein